ncbi:serine/threonine-protein kinase [Bacillus sp. SCS-153A]|uniref:serine/threonine-protein kinase n=1 Tax=Rossellomorea sedimentorum TaxID=3115294 RepID=UPI003906D130
MESIEESTWRRGPRIGNPGGFGAVFVAEKYINDVLQNGNYVLKELIQLDSDSIERFIREVRYLTKLNHPRIVKVVDFNLNSEPYFYVMERYQASLLDMMPSIKEDFNRIREVFTQVLEGLEYLHEEGYYHRDLKPGNVIGNSDDDLVLCDLGLCVNPMNERDRLTRTNMYGGTKFYCSPEQEQSLKYVDNRTDIYAFGKMLYEAFTGTTPPALDITSLPAPVQFLIRKSTKENKEERFSSVKELRQHFNIAMDLLIEGQVEGSLNAVINEITLLDEVDLIFSSDTLINRLADHLSRIQDKAVLNDAIMQLPAHAFRLLEQQYPDLFTKITIDSLELINSQSWPFSYTDTIADKLESVFTSIDNHDVRSNILKCILKLGVSHNRWHVMRVFVDLIQSIESDEEAFNILHSLSEYDHELHRVDNTISFDLNALHTVIRRLFR